MTEELIDVVPEDVDALVDGVADWSEQKKYDVFAIFITSRNIRRTSN